MRLNTRNKVQETRVHKKAEGGQGQEKNRSGNRPSRVVIQVEGQGQDCKVVVACIADRYRDHRVVKEVAPEWNGSGLHRHTV